MATSSSVIVEGHFDGSKKLGMNVHTKHADLEKIIEKILPIMTESLAEPFSELNEKYLKFYNACARAVTGMAVIYKSYFGQLIHATGDVKDFESILECAGAEINDLPDLFQYQEEFTVACTKLVAALSEQNAGLTGDRTVALTRLQAEIDDLIDRIKVAENDLLTAKNAKTLFDQNSKDNETKRTFFQKRRTVLSAQLESLSHKYKLAVEAHIAPTESKLTILGFDFDIRREKDTTDQQKYLKNKMTKIEEQIQIVDDALAGGMEEFERKMAQYTISITGFQLALKNLREQLDDKEKEYATEHRKELRAMFIRAGQGTVNAEELSTLIADINSIGTSFSQVVAMIGNLRQTLIKKAGLKLKPHNAMNGLMILMEAPVICEAITMGETPTMHSQQFITYYDQMENFQGRLITKYNNLAPTAAVIEELTEIEAAQADDGW